MKVFVLFLLLPLHLLAQDITGSWKGYLKTKNSQVPYEIVVGEEDDKLRGYSLTIFMFKEVENIGVKAVSLKSKKGIFLLEDGALVYDNYTTPPKRTKFVATLSLKEEGNKTILLGDFQTRSLDMRVADSYSGTVWLEKQTIDRNQSKLLAKLDELKLLQSLSFVSVKKQEEKTAVAKTAKQEPQKTAAVVTKIKETRLKEQDAKETRATASGNGSTTRAAKTANANNSLAPVMKTSKPAASVATRKTEIIQNISFSSDSLVLHLYDNGEIDGDTVSVVLNNQVLIAKKGLTTNAIRTVVHITPDMGDSLKLIMYAENLGRIPPNTGLLIVEDGGIKYEVRFAGDLQKNSAIILKRKRP